MNISDLDDDFLVDDDVPSPSFIWKELVKMWINERNSPEMLPYATEKVDCMMAQLDEMDNNLRGLKRDDFRVVPHQMEVNRIRYILASYHRCRLEKIETFAGDLIKQCELHPEKKIMSEGEYVFAQEFQRNRYDHFQSAALKYIPEIRNAMDSQEESNMTLPETHPNLKGAVFIEIVKSDLQPLILHNNEEIELPLGSKHLVIYEDVRTLIEKGWAVFI